MTTVTYRFSARATGVPSAGIAGMMAYAAKYKDTVSLGQGAPQFPTPRFIYDYISERSKTDINVGMYANLGTTLDMELKRLIQSQFAKNYGFTPELDHLYITLGGIGGLFATFMSLLEAGDEVIYFDPSYPLHLSQLHLTQAKVVFVSYDEESGWKLDIDKVKAAVTKRTKAIVLTNPNNPTGTVLSESEIRALSQIVLDHDLILVLDEAYSYLTYEKQLFSPMLIPELRDHIVLCKSFSKEYAMTGWRIGYLYANPKLIAKINNVHLYFTVTPPSISMTAAIAALSDHRGETAMHDFKDKLTASRTAIVERLGKLPKLFEFYEPDGAFYAFPKIVGINMPALDFAHLLVDEAKVVTIPGDSSGPAGRGHVRMSFAAEPELIHRAFDRIDTFAKKHGLQ